jgi:hypothetical protein
LWFAAIWHPIKLVIIAANLLEFHMKKIMFIAGLTLGLLNQGFGQVYTNKVVGEKNQEKADTLRTQAYPYLININTSFT